MRVKDLIALLNQLDQDKLIMVDTGTAFMPVEIIESVQEEEDYEVIYTIRGDGDALEEEG